MFPILHESCRISQNHAKTCSKKALAASVVLNSTSGGEKLKHQCFDIGKNSILVKGLGNQLVTNIEVYLYIISNLREKTLDIESGLDHTEQQSNI